MPKTKGDEEILQRIEREKIKWIDLQFVDVPGFLQHITIPSSDVSAKSFEEGIGKLDGSSIKGFKEIHESDMIMVPAPETFAILPWYNDGHRTARFIVKIFEGYKGGRFTRDPRYIAERAADAAKKMGYDVTYWGPELEFFVFDSVKLLPTPVSARDAWSGSGYSVESRESIWQTSSGVNFPIRFKEGYYPAPPVDTLTDFRNEAAGILQNAFSIPVDAHHHEVATAGQGEIDMRYDELVRMADNVTTYKQVLKMVASRMNMICTFMPKPIFGDNASGMHVHQSLWSKGKNVFYDKNDEYAEITQTCRYYIGGLMEHSKALSAVVAPTTNSYKRLVPGYEAPVYITWSRRNRSANVRVPVYDRGNEKSKRVEYRPPDTSCNIYLAFAAMLAAGLDGIKKKIDPGEPCDEDVYKLTPERRKALGIEELPGSLKDAIAELRSDCGFLKGIFTDDLLETHISLKMEEYVQYSIRPTPYEFYRYLDV